MDPIISPWTIYWINFVPALKTFCIAAIVLWPCIFFTFIANVPDKMVIAVVAISAVLEIMFLLGAVFLPNEKTVYMMLAASVVTPDNLSAVKDGTLGFIREVGEAVKEAYK